MGSLAYTLLYKKQHYLASAARKQSFNTLLAITSFVFL
jgi:hypothetical protein